MKSISRPNDIKMFDEFFITGTITEITPIIKIDDWIVGDGIPGKTTRKIQKLFYKEVKQV